MKNWIRIFFVCIVLVGGTAIFAYQLLNQFNYALEDISASSFVIANIPPPTPFSDKTDKEEIPIPTPPPEPETIPISPPEIISTSTPSTDLGLSFIFPKYNEFYIDCTYQLTFQSSTTLSLLKTTLIDAVTKEALEPTISGLTME